MTEESSENEQPETSREIILLTFERSRDYWKMGGSPEDKTTTNKKTPGTGENTNQLGGKFVNGRPLSQETRQECKKIQTFFHRSPKSTKFS